MGKVGLSDTVVVEPPGTGTRPRRRGRPRVLILGASYGDGHLKCADAFRAACVQLRPDLDFESLDFFEHFVSRRVNRVARFSYVQSVRRAPYLYGAFYGLTQRIPAGSALQRRLNALGRVRLQDFLQQARPDLIVSVYPTPAGVLSTLKLTGRLDIPCATIVTDYAVHSQWVHPGVDLYVVASEAVRRGLQERGIAADRIHATGIPIRAAFREPADADAVRRRYELRDDLPVVLVMPGAYGMMAGTFHVFKILASMPVQVIYVCGRDQRLRRRLERMAPRARQQPVVLGYVDTIPDLMTIADLMVTKAGGVTVSEALAKGLPMLIYRAIPGQERENTRFLTQVGAAVAVRSRRQLARALTDLLAHQERLEQMRQAALQAAHPEADLAAAQAVLALLPKRTP